ncbi:hypothetical protein CXIVA_24860 [Clostridium sp. SY8519]|nr:hypothetical protein CXIVA_24860 [Clostridium sp. SY8519]
MLLLLAFLCTFICSFRSPNVVQVFVRTPIGVRKLDALVTKYPEIYKCIKETDISKTYSMPKQYVNYRKPRRISEERREQIREQIKNFNVKKQEK